MVCTKCGREIEFGIDFCYYCGEELPDNVEKKEEHEIGIINETQLPKTQSSKNVIQETRYKEFPSVYERKMRNEEDERIQQVQRVSDAGVKALEDEIRGRDLTKEFGIKDLFEGAWNGIIIGFVVGVIACFTISDELFPICIFVGAIIGAVGIVMDNNSFKEKCQGINNSIEREKRLNADKIDKIKKETNNRITTYKTGFEDEAKKLSVRYAESTLAQEVIEWMTKGFVNTIESADRRSHIDKIDVPFRFSVYRNKITCNLGTYDFELKRCRNLNSPLEQVALARALASSIHLNITMKYPKDISGTNIVTNTEYIYGNDYVQVTLSYKAVNGNYESVRDWS